MGNRKARLGSLDFDRGFGQAEVLYKPNLSELLAALSPKRLYSYEITAHTPVGKLSEPLGLVSAPPAKSERDRLFPSRSLPYIATHTGGSHAFAF